MTEQKRRPLIVVEVSSDFTEAKPFEVPDLNDLLGEEITAMKPDARTFLKLQMLLRDQDFIGRMNNQDSLLAMFSEMVEGGYIAEGDIVGLYGDAIETFGAYKESVIREAEELGIPVPGSDPSQPTRPH